MIRSIFCISFLLGSASIFSQQLFDDFLLSEEKNPNIMVSETNYGSSESISASSMLLNAQRKEGEMDSKTMEFAKQIDESFKLTRIVNASSSNVEGSILLMESLYEFVKKGNFKKIEMSSSVGMDYFVGKQVGNIIGQMITVAYLDEGKVVIVSSEGRISIDVNKLQSTFK